MFGHLNQAIDVKLLQTLHLLLTECNVSKVALQLGQTQPAVSQSLRKAREIFCDPLLVRSGHMLVITERGEQIRNAVETMLGNLSEALSPVDEFNPREAQMRLRIAAVNCFGIFLIPTICQLIRREAPNMRVEFFSPTQHCDLPNELGNGKIDLVMGNWPAPMPSFRHTALMECGIACVARADHRWVGRGPMPLVEYLEEDHISPTPSTSAAYSPIDGRLYELGVQRRIATTVPEYGLIPAILAETDLLFTTARPYAEHVVASCEPGKLALLEAPAEFSQMRLYLLWHERAQASAPNRWLRELIKRVAKRFDMSLGRGRSASPSVGPVRPGREQAFLI